MIRLEQVSKRYDTGRRAVEALRDICVEIERGEYVALVGPSGSGKSTLLHLIGCLDRPTSGRYHLDGINVGALGINDLAEIRNRKIGFVFQRFHLLPRLSACENVTLPMRLARRSLRAQQERAAALLRRVGLEDRLSHRPTELSGGEQQRVAIARAVANEPAVLLADEPTGNLDSQSGAEVVRLLEELLDEGRTVIVVTHDEGLSRRAHRTIRLHDGRIVV
jgi:putative ABC transport system ATP-binding protein